MEEIELLRMDINEFFDIMQKENSNMLANVAMIGLAMNSKSQ